MAVHHRCPTYPINGAKLENRGSVAHAHPETIIGILSSLAHALTIDLLHDISTSVYTCRSHDSANRNVGAASCRDRPCLAAVENIVADRCYFEFQISEGDLDVSPYIGLTVLQPE
jgi:hypothetical protein